MKLILLQNIKGLGNKGDVVNAKDGYAQNFLIPKKMAELATANKVEQVESEKKEISKHEAEKKRELESLIQKISEQKIKLTKQASDKGKLFAAITPDEIINQIEKDLQVNLKKFKVNVDEHVKEVGEHQVQLNINGRKCEINLVII